MIRLEGAGRTVVHRRGRAVIRDTGPWTPAVHALLRHLEQTGFTAAPRLIGPGLDQDGREMLTFIDGEFTQPGPWSLDGAAALAGLLRDLHRATATFRPPARCGSPGTAGICAGRTRSSATATWPRGTSWLAAACRPP
jgi:hypothetical protein